MPSIRGQPPSPSRSDRSMHIRARIYRAHLENPISRFVPTQIISPRRSMSANMQGTQRYPWVEALFEHRYIQPYIHDTKIVVNHGGSCRIFLVFCQNHLHLPPSARFPGWRGDIVVMKLSKGTETVINMRPDDGHIIDQAIEQFVQRTQQRTPFRFPKNLVFEL